MEAIKVSFANNEEHIILVSHKIPVSHTNFYVVDGTQAYGEVILIKRNIKGENVIVIR